MTGGNAIAEAVAAYVDAHRDEYQLIVTTQDWHIDPGAHFSETPDFVDTWPPHGVAGTAEAELHPALAHVNADVTIKKGQYEAAYSGFEGTTEDGTTLEQALRAADITDVDAWASPNRTASRARRSTPLARTSRRVCWAS